MSTLSIIAITIIAALLSILLIAAISALVYVYIIVRRQISALSLTVSAVESKLDLKLAEIRTLIGNVNGNEIRQAAQVLIEIVPRIAKEATRVEQTCTAFRGALEHLVRDEEISGSAIDRARQSGLLPDSYAPAQPGEHYISRSRVAADDQLAFAEESADNSTTGSESGAVADLNSGRDLDTFRSFGD